MLFFDLSVLFLYLFLYLSFYLSSLFYLYLMEIYDKHIFYVI